MTWPDFYPDNCPPSEAEPHRGDIYMFRMRNEAVELSFTPYIIKCPERVQPGLECIGSGVYCFRTLRELRHMMNAIPKIRRNAISIKTSSRESDGLHKNTGSSKGHYTWWLVEGIEPWNHAEDLVEAEASG